MSAKPTLLDRYLTLFPAAERHEREREIRPVIIGENDPYLITAIHSAESRQATLDAIALHPQMPRRSFFFLTAVVGAAVGLASALIMNELAMRPLREQLAALEVTAEKTSRALVQANTANKQNYELASQFREMLVMGVVMARTFNATPNAGIGRDHDDLLLVLPKGTIVLDTADPKFDRFVIRRDLIGTGVANDMFEQELEKADAKMKASTGQTGP